MALASVDVTVDSLPCDRGRLANLIVHASELIPGAKNVVEGY